MSTTVKTPQTFSGFLPIRPSAETDRELLWLFERAEQEIAGPTQWESLVEAATEGRSAASRGAERRADALHRGNTIVLWLNELSPFDDRVIAAAYRRCAWPHRYELKLGRLSGVVAALRSARVKLDDARALGARAENVAEWFEELLTRGEDEIVEKARVEALRLYTRALAAYRAARGSRPSLVGDDDP